MFLAGRTFRWLGGFMRLFRFLFSLLVMVSAWRLVSIGWVRAGVRSFLLGWLFRLGSVAGLCCTAGRMAGGRGMPGISAISSWSLMAFHVLAVDGDA
jgi:hypothetical protein